MKFTNEIISALEILKQNAESEFELHRISVLEKDLSEPPKVVQLDETAQKFNGLIYRKAKSSQHYRSNIEAHRDIWRYYYGEIPEGYLIRHKDLNPENNAIENLQLVTIAEHRRIHNYAAVRKTGICKYCGKLFEFRNIGIYNAAFCSESCRKKYNRERSPFEVRICDVCGKEFRTRKITERTTCSEECGRKKHSKNYNPEKITAVCQRCGKVFETLKNKPSAFCSMHCKNLVDYSRTMEERICVICGKIFVCHKAKPTKTCSPHCSMKLNWQTRRNQENKEDNASTSNSSVNEMLSAGIGGVM